MKILLIDDDPAIQMIVAATLEASGENTVSRAGSGQEGLDRARAGSHDVILLDHFLPDLDGPELLQELRDDARLREVPVIFLTGRSEPEEVAQLERLDVVGVITKPFRPGELRRRIDTLLEAAGGP